MKKIVKILNQKSKSKIAIVASPYYKLIYENLLKGALDELSRHNIDSDSECIGRFRNTNCY